MRAVRIAAVDPSLRNFGIARLVVELDTLRMGVESLFLIETEKRSSKVVRQNSDDLRRAQEIVKSFHKHIAGCSVCFAEIPTGAQSASAHGAPPAPGVAADVRPAPAARRRDAADRNMEVFTNCSTAASPSCCSTCCSMAPASAAATTTK
jgi:hypothetical protein